MSILVLFLLAWNFIKWNIKINSALLNIYILYTQHHHCQWISCIKLAQISFSFIVFGINMIDLNLLLYKINVYFVCFPPFSNEVHFIYTWLICINNKNEKIKNLLLCFSLLFIKENLSINYRWNDVKNIIQQLDWIRTSFVLTSFTVEQ